MDDNIYNFPAYPLAMHKVALLDAGAQLEKVIMRRVLEQGYSIDKFRADAPASVLRDYDAIIISGGPRSVYEDGALLPDKGIYSLGKPILGICYGIQAIAFQLGGKVAKGTHGQYGRSYIDIVSQSKFFDGLEPRQRVLMSHFDTVQAMPEGFRATAMSDGMVAAMEDSSRNIYAVQYHPELVPVTKEGERMFENFLQNVCRFPQVTKRTIEQEIADAKRIIYDTVGSDKHVMNYLSGGVDSTLTGILLKECVEPDRLFNRTLDTGSMRLGEIEFVQSLALRLELPNFKVIDTCDRFEYAKHEIEVKGVGKTVHGPLFWQVAPEIKRKLFGTEYADIAYSEMQSIAHELGITLEMMRLGQGTLRPDVIESGDERVTKGDAHTIKTHHNAVDRLKSLAKVEPLIELFKDQVREIALHYGLPEEFAFRQPFPGPGLLCRIIGYSGEHLEYRSLRDLDETVGRISREQGLEAHILPIKTVGVQGDERSYKHPVVVSGPVDWESFARFALSLPNMVREINRVVYSPGRMIDRHEAFSLVPTRMTRDVIRQAQECDAIMREIAGQYGYNDSRKCSQMPGILIPCSFGLEGKRSYVVRPTWTKDFMAIIGMMPSVSSIFDEEHFPAEMFYQMAEEIPKRVSGIANVLLDPTDKPPASTEWE
jgi:GMP synthase (glutamine-hydrolysing)